MKQFALEYLRRGWAIMPIRAGTKMPHVKWAPYVSKRPTEKEVSQWWDRWPNAGIALICGKVSGVVVVDVDPLKGGIVPDEATDLMSRTGGAGFHLFYACPKNVDVPNSVDLRPGVDIRGHGGYVILPPSVHKSANVYWWLSEGEPGPCPQWVIDGNKAAKASQGGDTWLSAFLAGKSEDGTRNDDIARFTGYLAKKRIPEDIALQVVANSLRKQKNPLPEQEVRTTVASVYRTAARKLAAPSSPTEWKKKDYDREDSKFCVTEMDDFMVKHGQSEMRWLVKDWIPDKTIAFLASPPGSYKTWLTFDIALSVASGKDFLGQFKIERPGPVLLIQQEDFHGQVADRIAVISLAKHGISNGAKNEGDQFIIEVPPKMDHFFGIHEERALRFDDEEVLADFARLIAKVKPRLVIIDPLYYAVDGGNYMQEAVKDLGILKTLRDEYGTTFMLVHHTKKSAEDMGRQNMWGSQFLNAFLETGWQVRKVDGDESKSIVITRHFKAAESGVAQHVTFDIDTTPRGHHYKVSTRDATDEEVESAAAQKQKSATERLDIYVETLRMQGACTNQELADHTGKNKSSVSRALVKLQGDGRVGKTVGGKWESVELGSF